MAATKPATKKVAKSNKPVAKKAPAVTSKQTGKKPAAKAKPMAKAKTVVSASKKKPSVPAKLQSKKPALKKPVKKAPIAVPAKKKAPTVVAKKNQVKAKSTVKVAPKPVKKVTTVAPKKIIKNVPSPKAKPETKPKVMVAPPKAVVPIKKPITPTSIPIPIMPAKKKEEVKPTKIVVPKTTVKTAVKYEPDFTKSVLDTNEKNYEPGSPSMRYSDSDLAEFRDLINRKLDVAKKELAYLQGLITHKDEMGGDNDDARYMTMEDGSLSMEREQLSQMASRQITFVDHLEKALMRIESKTYGICRVTGKLIDKARLRAVPHATLSVEAKMGKVR